MKVVRALVILAVLLVTQAVITPVSAADPAPLAASAGQEVDADCVMAVDKVRPGEEFSTVTSLRCRTGDEPLLAPASSVPIMVIFDNINYGTPSRVIYGNDGYCDASGYRINFTSGDWWRRISSFQYAGGCDYVNAYQAWNETGYCAQYFGNVPWVGHTMNDKIASVRVSAQRLNCYR